MFIFVVFVYFRFLRGGFVSDLQSDEFPGVTPHVGRAENDLPDVSEGRNRLFYRFL